MKRNVPVSTIMTGVEQLTTIHLAQKLSEARKAMADGGFHHVPVVSGTRLVGILSTTDILRVSYDYQTDGRTIDTVLDHTVKLEDLMTRDPVRVRATDPIRTAIERFAEGRYHSLPVVDADENLVGLVTTTDVMRYVLEQY